MEKPDRFQTLKLKSSHPWSRRDTKTLVLMGFFVALSIVLTRIAKPVDLPFVKVTFGFIATSFASMLLGPLLSGLVAAVSDVAGYFLFPSSGAFFPGFTFSAFLTGVIYGLFLYKKPKTLLRVILAVLVVSVVVDLGFNTVWLSILYDKAWTYFFISRLVKTAIMLPVQIAFIHLLWRYVGRRVEHQFD